MYSCAAVDDHFGCQQVDEQVWFRRLTAQVAGKLMQHQPSGNIGCVDGTLCCAATGLSFGLMEECCRVVLTADLAGDREYADDFAQHSPVYPEPTPVLGRAPDRSSGRNRVDAAERRFADFVTRPKTVFDD